MFPHGLEQNLKTNLRLTDKILLINYFWLTRTRIRGNGIFKRNVMYVADKRVYSNACQFFTALGIGQHYNSKAQLTG